MAVSKNSGTPKSSILIGFSMIFTIHFGVPLFLETPIFHQPSHFPKQQPAGPCAPQASVYEVPPRFALANAPQQPATVTGATRSYNGNLRGPPIPALSEFRRSLLISLFRWLSPHTVDHVQCLTFAKPLAWKEKRYKLHTKGFCKVKLFFGPLAQLSKHLRMIYTSSEQQPRGLSTTVYSV